MEHLHENRRGAAGAGVGVRSAPACPAPDVSEDDDDGLLAELSDWAAGFFRRSEGTAPPATADASLLESARQRLAETMIAAIRSVSCERDREEVVRWFANASTILNRPDATTTESATELYKTVDTRRFAGILANTAKTSAMNYAGSSLPLALKVAMPVAGGGALLFGAQGAGIAAFGSAIGLPVALLLFLGTAGLTTVVEAFVKDRGIRDPLTKLMLAFVAADAARRIDKEMLKAMRADAMVPKRAEVPAEHALLSDHLCAMDPFDFERHVMTFFEHMGHPVGVTPQTNDGGFDGYVIHPDGLIVVQCKRYAPGNPVGSPEVQQLMGVILQKSASRGYVVTTSSFTRAALDAAATCDRLTLVGGAELVRWHSEGCHPT